MSGIFLTLFLTAYLLTIWLEKEQIKKAGKRSKLLYYGINLLTFGLLTGLLFRIDVYTPVHFFVRQVAPWVISIIGPN